MTAPLSAQSAIEILESEWHTGDSVQALIVLRRVVKDYSSLRAENERLREQHKTDEGVNLRLCEMHTNQQKELHNLGKAYKKAEAEVKRLKTWHCTISEVWKLAAEKAEAELAKQAPLVEAAMGATPWGGMNPLQLEFYPDDAKNILRAALALREGKK